MSDSSHLTRGKSSVSYSYDNLSGWKRLRPLRPFRGMYHDVRRRLPYYWSDFSDALTYRTIASTIRMYFVNILPAIAYTLDMYRRTGEFYGINEALFSSALAAMIFSLLGAQPLTIVGITGLISLFNYTIYDIVTREYGSAAGFMSTMIAILYFLTIYGLEMLGSSTICRPWFRGLLADYAYVIATIFWVGFAHIPGNLKSTGISFVPITRAFYPTQPRGWLIHFWELEVKWVFAALPFGFLVMLLFYYDHNVSSLGAQARQFPLKKPAGFHWDFFLLGCTTFLAGITGIPMPNGLVPQAPVHTDSLTIYETSLAIIPTSEGEGSELRRPITKATAVVEQRLSHFLMGLAIIGTMTGPLLIVLHTMPAAVFAGVFFIVGWRSIESNGILKKLVFLAMENRFIQRDEPLLRVQKRMIGVQNSTSWMT
ncbi:hypothetical protein N8T08_008945 [Aspergillus melleus]|uniref:Uncharacterized protein n=1 Tax=Aspergillus melleus TaxID=138277 RepID=A0ACC3AVA5_9EURO|nr:hypothetical protein N8T08_008945 [Aspergillus melleus]